MHDALQKYLPKGFSAFVAAGAVGFLVDATVLGILVHGYDWGRYSARLVSFAVAVTATWALNRSYAFGDSRTHKKRTEYARYISVQLAGMLINFLVYSACISTSPIMDRWPVLALAVGSAAALIFNYVGARLFVFTGAESR